MWVVCLFFTHPLSFVLSLLQYHKCLIWWGGKLISAEVCSEAGSLMWGSLHPPRATQSNSALSLSNPFKHTGLKKNTPASAVSAQIGLCLHCLNSYTGRCFTDEPETQCVRYMSREVSLSLWVTNYAPMIFISLRSSDLK